MARLVSQAPLGAIPAGEGLLDIVGAQSEEAALLIVRNPLGGGYVTTQIGAAINRATQHDSGLAAVLKTVPRVYFTVGRGTEIPGAWRFLFKVYLLKS